MSLILLGITVFACGIFTIKRPDTRWFGGFGDPYATNKRLKLTQYRGVLSLIMGALIILLALVKFLLTAPL